MPSLRPEIAIVPAFNEGAVIYQVVSELRAVCPSVVVVDDGSSDDTAGEARRAGAVVLRHVINRGQGAALQTGIDYCLRAGAEVVITFDADGQHQAGDVTRLLDALRESGADMAIGSRFLGSGQHIPFLRRSLLRVATLFMRLSSGVPLTDAHNGLRALRRRAASALRIKLDGMAHASEIVDRIRSLQLSVIEVPVVIRYSAYSLRKGQSGLAAFRIAFDYLVNKWLR